MSSSNRAASRGGKAIKTTEGGKSHGKTDGKTDNTGHKTGGGGSGNSKSQATANEIRLAQIMDLKSEDPSIREKVCQVMEATRRPEEEVCLILHDCDYDMNKAVNSMLEGTIQGGYETSVKKKKNRQTSTSKTEATESGGAEDWDSGTAQNVTNAGAQSGSSVAAGTERERSRTRGGAPPRLSRGRGDSRGWRGREGRDGDRHQEDGGRGDNYRRSRMSNGPGRGGGAGRGGRGGRMGPRSYQGREGGSSRGHNRAPVVDTWDTDSTYQHSQNQNGMKKRNDNFPQPEEWDNEEYRGSLGNVETWNDSFPQPEDWDNEEYTGSLADTKVFTPSQAMEAAALAAEAAAAAAAAEQAAAVAAIEPTVVPAEVHGTPTAAQQLTQALEMRVSQQEQLRPPVHLQQPQSTTLSAAQSQYLSQLTQQSSENMKAVAAAAAVAAQQQQINTAQSYQNSPGAYTSTPANAYNTQNYGQATTNYGAASMQELQQSVQSQQPPRTKTQRARVPPPSKIPASAVEMPGDLNANMGLIDLQFGGLDLVSENNSFDNDNKYSGGNVVMDSTVQQQSTQSNIDLNSSVNQSPASAMDTYSANTTAVKQSNQANINAALVQNQILPNTDSISQANDHLSSAPSGYAASRGSVPTSNTVPPAIDSVNKTADVGHNSYSQPQNNSYQSYQSQKSNSSAYQNPAYNSTSYSSSTQVTSSSSYPSNQSANSYSNSNTSNSAYNNQNTVNNSYQTSSYSTASSYQSVAPAFASISQPNSSFPNNQATGYQTNPNQSVYATGTGINNTNSYPNQYNSYNTTSSNHKLTASGKEQVQYDSSNTVNAVSSVSAAATNAAVSSGSATQALAVLSQTSTAGNTKVTTTSAAKSGVLANIPPGVAPVMGAQYIMGQAGIPFYQQPVYSFEDLQLIAQQRIPHMTTGYYDIPYQAPTSLAAGGERGLASVAYSMSDGRFPRADNNASPVPSTISQQTTTQAHQAQPMLNAATLPPGYAYFYNTNVMPGGFQYGTPAIYPQMPTATNAHGSTTSSQYPKPGSYGSGYNSGYDALSQSQDYNKSSYGGGNQSQNKTGVAVTTGSSATDLTMYGKSHVALGKVNSYEKQGFHSGTPPPFNLAGNQSTGLAPSGQYAPHLFIPTMAPHQTHHNTTLMHQPLHQMDVRQTSRRTDSGNSSGQRSQTSSQPKPGSKQGYQASYWNQA